MIDLQTLPQALARYRQPNPSRALFELAVTLVPLVGLWVLMWLSLDVGYWLTLLLAVPAAGLVVRLFMIQHDCGHGSFFPDKRVNDWVGRALSILTLAPYDFWRRSHAIHHATSGNLDRRGVGDIDTLTVAEYRARSWWGRLRYRLYRHPLVLFGLGPTYYFLLQSRLPVGFMRKNGWAPWISTMATNLGIAAASALVIWAVGLKLFLLIQLPVWIVASAMGVWLFYVQHQFDSTFWAKTHGWDIREAALLGSSHYDLPPVLRWFTANIGVHHVHHLSSRIPYYRLGDVLRDFPELRSVSRMTLRQSLKTVPLALWDENSQRLVTFSSARA